MAGEAFVIKGVVGVDVGPLEQGMRRANGLVSGFGASVAGAGIAMGKAFAAATVAGVAATSAGLAVAVKEASNFEKTMSGVAAVAGATKAEMKELSDLALRLGADTSFSATEAAQGLEELVKAGVSMADIMGGAAKSSLDLAAAGEISVKDAATIAAQAMNTFSLAGADMAHVADVIAGAANASAIDVGQFKFSLQAAGAVASTVGFSFDDLAQAIAVMGNAGIVGSDAGTSLKTMMMGLQPQTDKQIKLFRELGLLTEDGANKFFDATGKVKSMAEVSQILQDATKSMTDQQRLATLEILFGSDAIRAGAVLAKAGAAGFEEVAEAIGKVSAADVAETRLDNLAGSFEKLQGSISTVTIRIGTAFIPSIRRLVDMATETVDRWEPAITAFAERIPDAMDHLIDRSLALAPRLMDLAGTVDWRGWGAAAVRVLGLAREALTSFWRTARSTFADLKTVALGALPTLAGFWRTTQGAFADLKSAVLGALPAVQGALQTVVPSVIELGKAFVDNLASTIRWVTRDVLPPLLSIFEQTAGFFLSTLRPAVMTTTAVFRGILGDTLGWLAQTVWPPLLEIGRQTAGFWTAQLLPAIQIIARTLRTVLGESVQWLATTGWPALLRAAGGVVDLFVQRVVPLLPDLARGLRNVLGTAITWVAETGWPALVRAGTAVSNWITVTAVPAITRLVEWIGPKVNTAVSWLISTGWPALVSASKRVSDWVTGTAVPALSTLVSWLGTKVSGAVSWLMETGWPSLVAASKRVSDWITGTAIPAIRPLVTWIGERLRDAATWVYETGWPKFVEAATKVSDWINGTAIPKFKDFVSWLDQKTRPAIQWFIDTGWPGIVTAGGKVVELWQGLVSWTQKFWDKLAESDALDILSEALDAVWNAGKILVEAFWPQMKDGAEKAFDPTDVFVEAVRVGAGFVLAFALGVETLAKAFVALKKAFDEMPDWWIDGIRKGIAIGGFGPGGGLIQPFLPSQAVQQGQQATGAVTTAESASSFGPIDNSSRTSFVRTAWPYMLQAAGGNRDLAEMMLAAAISENGDVGGGGDFIGNNFFGIKGQGTAGSFTARTWEWEDGARVPQDAQFAAFNTPVEGFAAFLKFLEDNPRYSQALARFRQTGDASQLFRDINAAGYATDPHWASTVESIRGDQVAPFTKDLQAVVTGFNAVEDAFSGVTAAVPPMERGFEAVTQTTDNVGRAFEFTTQEAGHAGKGFLSLGDTIGIMARDGTTSAERLRRGVGTPISLMTDDATRSVTRLGTGVTTVIADMAGTSVTTIADMSGNVIDQYATLANGAKLSMSDMADGTRSSVTLMGDQVQTVIEDAAGNVLTTVTDMQGNVVDQTVRMATGATGAARTLASGVAAQIETMGVGVVGRTIQMTDGTLSVMRDGAGNLVSIVRNAAGDIVRQYTTMSHDAASQAAELARASAIHFGTVRNSADDAADAINDLGDVFRNSLSQFSGTFKFTPSKRAAGGPVSAFTPYVVGELGPELFVPPTDGNIVPNHMLRRGHGGGGGVQTIRIVVERPTGREAEEIVVEGYDLAVRRGRMPALRRG